MRCLFPVFLVILLFLSFSAFSQSNPFLSGGSSEINGSADESGEPGGLSTWPVIGTLVLKSAAAQRSLQLTIAETMNEVNHRGSIRHLAVLLGISFVFGILHAIGPGHRKAVLVTYFLGEATKPLKGFITGFLLALVHAASSIVLVGGLYLFTTRSLLLSVDRAHNILFPVTYTIILLLGIWMIFQGVTEHRHRSGKSTEPVTETRRRTGIGGLILSGLVPCPAASAIMILAVAGNAVPVGILSVLVMSLGMGTLLAILGLLTILMRNRISGLLQNSLNKIELFLHLLSGLAMVLFGLFMTLGSL